MFAGTLVAEEITDQLQREAMKDNTLQPLTRMVSKIHVTEEARHVRYAREELGPDRAQRQLRAARGWPVDDRADGPTGSPPPDPPGRLPQRRAGSQKGPQGRQEQPALPGVAALDGPQAGAVSCASRA